MYAMLSLDLERYTTDENREKFYEYLKKEQWIKVPRVTTTWYASFKDGATEQGIVSAAKTDVANAAKYAGVSSYNAVVNVGPSMPTTF
jgi:hypothetical protein